MNGILELKGQLQGIYAAYSKYIDKAVRFVLAVAAFFLINHDIGFMQTLKNPVIVLGLSIVCAFLPTIFTVLAAAALVIGHVYTVSLGMMLVTAITFLLMFIFYLRLAPKTAVVVLLMPLACMLKIPAAVPVAVALTGTPVYAVPAALGTVIYYLIQQVKESAGALQTAEEGSFITDITSFAKQVFSSKEMWLFVLLTVICVFAVYGIRRSSITHAWKAASVAGAVIYIIVAIAGGAVLGVEISYASVFIGAVAAVIVGLILEILFFSVDYSRSENLQYEDDEYYYYVKAVPKVGVSAPEKTVKKINRRDEAQSESEVIDSGELRRRAKKPAGGKKKNQEKSPARRKKISENAEHLLLTRSLRKDLNLDEEEK